MKRVFLGGTCNDSTWRDALISSLTIDAFNPVVKDWDESAQIKEIYEKANKCNVHLYVITKEMTGVFSIAEAIDSVHTPDKLTIFQVIPEGFEGHQLKSLQAVVDLINKRGGIAFVESTLSRLTGLLNSL